MNGVIKEEEQQQEQIGVSGAPAADGANGGGGGGGGQLEPEQFRKLFIGGLSLNTTDETLHSFYSQFGELVDCIVMRDSSTKRSRGFGFVSFSLQAEVDRAMEARPHTIDGKVVDPKRAVPRDQSQKSEQNMSTKRLYVSGVREEHTEDDFERHFSEYGKVTKVEIISDKNTQKTRGFAFITFDDYDPVDRCVLLKSHMIKGFRCDVKKALSREEMQKAQQKERDRAERGVRSRGNGRRDGGGGGYGRGGGGGYGGHHGGGYGGYGGGYGGPPQWGPPAGPPQWGGYGGGYGQYGQTAPAPWSAPAGGPAGPQATEQGQWGGGYGAQGGGWGGGGGSGGQWPAGGGAANATGTGGDYSGTWGNTPQGVPPPQQWSGAQRF